MRNSEFLTPRQKEIMTLISQGIRHNEIAEKLEIEERTVKFHLHLAREKLNAKNTIQAVAISISRGLVVI